MEINRAPKEKVEITNTPLPVTLDEPIEVTLDEPIAVTLDEPIDTVITSPLDSATGALETLDYAHHEIHSGTHYAYRSYHAISKNTTLDHLIITPDTTKWAHMVISVESTAGETSVNLYEDTVTSDLGTLENSHNRNRNIANNNTTEIYEAPTVTSAGTVLAGAYFGTGKKGFGGGGRDQEEYVLKQNTKYLLRITEENFANTNVTMVFDWYEHTNK